jgi:hypothetical protein
LGPIPFFVVRLVYSVLASYAQPPIAARAVMSTSIEAILVGLYLLSGVLTSPRQSHKNEEKWLS